MVQTRCTPLFFQRTIAASASEAAASQMGPGHKVSGMRQRLGRSGRRPGQAAVMRVYGKEAELDDATHPLDGLRAETVQSIAMLNLMLRKWNEPPEPGRLHLSTLLNQIMALVGQGGGVTAAEAWDVLFGVAPSAAWKPRYSSTCCGGWERSKRSMLTR